MLRSGIKKNPEGEGKKYAQNSKPQFQRAKNLVDPVITGIVSRKDPKTIRVLDIGCGIGDIAVYLATRYGVFVHGIDVAIEMINTAREKYSDIKNVQFIAADAATFYFPQAFDLIISTSTLQWISDDKIQLVFRIIHQHLKDDGEFVFLVATYDFPHHVIKDHVAYTEKWKRHFVNYVEPQSLVRTRETYQQLLNNAGFENTKLQEVRSKHISTPEEFIQFTQLWCGCFHILKDEDLQRAFSLDVKTAFFLLSTAALHGQRSFEQVSIVGVAKKTSVLLAIRDLWKKQTSVSLLHNPAIYQKHNVKINKLRRSYT